MPAAIIGSTPSGTPLLIVPPPTSSPSTATAPPPYNGDLPTGNRPQLPMRSRNRFLGQAPTATDPDALVVKFQTIVREEREIVVGRLKIATNASNEHAFILRRYDTGAISVTTMYKAAFPSASAEEEDREMRWIKSTFDLTGMNGSRGNNSVKLAGNWIPPNLATHLAPAYRLASWIHAMVEASPEAGVAYRKSQRSQAAAEEAAARHNGAQGSPNGTTPPMYQSHAPLTARADTGIHTSRGPVAPATAPSPQAVTGSASAPKRQRTDAVRSSPSAARATPRSPLASSAQTVPHNSEPTVAVTIQTVTEITGPANIDINADAQVAESRALVARLTADFEARSAAGESAEEMGLVDATGGSVRGVKRTVEESEQAEVTQTGSGSGAAVTVSTDGMATEGRLIAGNKRVKVVAPEVANRGNAVWGPAFLAVGGAVGWLAANYWL